MTVAVFEDQDHVRPSSSPQGCGLSKSLQISGENIIAISSEPEKLSGCIFSALNFLKQNHMNNRTVRRFSRKKLGSRDILKSLQISPNPWFRRPSWSRSLLSWLGSSRCCPVTCLEHCITCQISREVILLISPIFCCSLNSEIYYF